MEQSTTADRAARLVFAGLLLCAIYYINFRFVLVHFAVGSELLDSGWYAWIFSSGDPWLTAPRAVSNLSYFNYHLTPYLVPVTLLLHQLPVDRFVAFALHQGAIFTIFAAALYAIVLTSWMPKRSGLLLATVAVYTLLDDGLLQITGFPHPELAILGFSAVGIALWQNKRHVLGALAFGVACLVREDGGLYAAAFLFGLALMPPLSRRTPTSLPALLGAGAVVLSLVMFVIKAKFFAGFSAFAFNYSGDNWHHLTGPFVLDRFLAFVRNPHVLTSVVPALILGLIAWRYALFVLFMAPVIVAQMLAARNELGHFTAYYVIPFVAIWVGMVLVAADRSRNGTLTRKEPMIMLLFAMAGSAIFMFAANPPARLPILITAVVLQVPDLPKFAADTASVAANVPNSCVSIGVAALTPDSFEPSQVLGQASDITPCQTVFLFNNDWDYLVLRWRMSQFVEVPTGVRHIKRYDRPQAQRP